MESLWGSQGVEIIRGCTTSCAVTCIKLDSVKYHKRNLCIFRIFPLLNNEQPQQYHSFSIIITWFRKVHTSIFSIPPLWWFDSFLKDIMLFDIFRFYFFEFRPSSDIAFTFTYYIRYFPFSQSRFHLRNIVNRRQEWENHKCEDNKFIHSICLLHFRK